MLPDVLEKPMGRKKASSSTTPVRIDSEIAEKAAVVAAYEKKSLTELASELLGPLVEKKYRDHAKRAAGKPEKSSD